jgi:UDP-N-acetylglucosamine:LPS N-acetylglucosamine transferase
MIRPRQKVMPIKKPAVYKASRGTFAGMAYEDFGSMGLLDFNKLMSDASASLQKAATTSINKEIEKLTGTAPKPQTVTVTQQQLPANIVYMNQPQGPSFFEENKKMIMIVGGSVAALLLGLIIYKAAKK